MSLEIITRYEKGKPTTYSFDGGKTWLTKMTDFSNTLNLPRESVNYITISQETNKTGYVFGVQRQRIKRKPWSTKVCESCKKEVKNLGVHNRFNHQELKRKDKK